MGVISILLFLASIVLFILFIVFLCTRVKALWVGLSSLFCFIFGFLLLVVGLSASSGNESSGASSLSSETSASESELEQETSQDDVMIHNLTEILESIGIDPKDAENLERIDDWANGPIYRFNTLGKSVFVYCNMDNTVNAVRIGNSATGLDLYKQGYETWTIDSITVDDDMQITLQIYTEDAVMSCLNYPSTADFSIWDWRFSREFDHYQVTGSVKAQNAFGVEEDLFFKSLFYDQETLRLIYLEVGGEVVLNEIDDYPLPERKETGEGLPDMTSQSGEIRIVDEQLGEYGERVDLDGWEYCWYHVPAGTYTVVSNVKSCLVYVEKNEVTRNSDGFVEMENVITLEMVYGVDQEVTIAEDEHIFLTVGADITLIPVE